MSYPGFFSLFKGRSNCYSGTAGTKAEQQFIRDNYGSDVVIIPPFIPKESTEFTTILVKNKTQATQSIVDDILRAVAQNRAVLVVFDTINDVKTMERYLIKTRGYIVAVSDKEVVFRSETEGDGLIYNLETKQLNILPIKNCSFLKFGEIKLDNYYIDFLVQTNVVLLIWMAVILSKCQKIADCLRRFYIYQKKT